MVYGYIRVSKDNYRLGDSIQAKIPAFAFDFKRKARTSCGPKVKFGTKEPSITSKCPTAHLKLQSLKPHCRNWHNQPLKLTVKL
jgi:hypothetical protein